MMAYELKDNSGSLFKNDRRTTDKHPQMKGRCMVGGVEYWVSAWTKEGNNGKPRWQSLAFTPVEKQQAAPPQQNAEPEPFDESSIPF